MATEEELQAAINRVPREYSEFIPIMTTEASLELPQHSAYDHAIQLRTELHNHGGLYTHSTKLSLQTHVSG